MLVKDSIRGPEFDATAHRERRREHYSKTERDRMRQRGKNMGNEQERARE